MSGPWNARLLEAGRLHLDGGAMFGNVPRVLWEQRHPPDDRNRILLHARVLLLRAGGRTVLVDAGPGSLWDPGERERYGVAGPGEPPLLAALREAGVAPEAVTDLVLTHLHFDHAGGAVQAADDGGLVPSLPRAAFHLQARNLEAARNPNPRERRSYLERHWRPLLESGRLRTLEGRGEILPGLRVEVSEGHTAGLQVVLVETARGVVVFPADLVPTSEHVRVPWTMGYDLCPRTIMEEKRELLHRAARGGWIVVFEHDPRLAAARIVERDGRFEPAGTTELEGSG